MKKIMKTCGIEVETNCYKIKPLTNLIAVAVGLKCTDLQVHRKRFQISFCFKKMFEKLFLKSLQSLAVPSKH